MKTPNKEDKLKFSLFFLKLNCEKVLEILESIKDHSLIKVGWTKSLNEAYCEFIEEIKKILNIPEFKELKNEAPHFYQSLSGELTEIDYTWNEYKQNLYNFLNEINKHFLEVANGGSRIDQFLQNFEELTNKNVQELIKENHEILRRESERVIKSMDRINRLKTELDEHKKDGSDRFFEWIKKDRILKIKGHDPIEFKGFRERLVDFFYDQSGERKWLNYDDIRQRLGSMEKAEDIRKAIEKINQRIIKETKNKYEGIIEIKFEEDQKKQKKYRWKY